MQWRIIHLLVFFAFFSCAQPASEIIRFEKFACSYYGEEITGELSSYEGSSEAQQMISNILSVIGLKQNFDIRAADVPNAAAVISKGRRLILYNPDFINAINNATGTNWSGISIMAHEIGHHLNGHTLTATGSRPEIELEADEFSGFVLRKLGASLKDAQSEMSVAAGARASHTHPAKKDRLIAIANGWNNADRQVAGTSVQATTNKSIERPIVQRQPEKIAVSAIDEKYIAFDVKFSADPNGIWYVTVRGNLVKVENNELFIAGRFADSNKKGYRYMFYDKYFNYLYINSNGNIYNGNGKRVGEMKTHG